MKKYSLFLIIFFLISIGSSFKLIAQDKSDDQKKSKEYKMQQSIEQQKKAMADQAKEKAEAEENVKENQINLEYSSKDQDEANEDDAQAKVFMKIPRNRSFHFDQPFVFNGNDQDMFGGVMGEDSERSTWDFSKTVKDNTFTRDYTFDVEKTAKSVIMSVMGDCKSGEIRIKIVMPSGKSYSDILIDESGNLNWRKSFPISETENQDKAGDWKFQITSTKATGFFKISLQTY